MWITVTVLATSNERLRLPTIGDHGNCHLMFGLNKARVVCIAVSGNLRELVLWIGRQTYADSDSLIRL